MVTRALVLLYVLSLESWVFVADAAMCNEAVCASVVSKCMLTQSCKCDLTTHYSCCKDCKNCLSYLYNECCSCVDMCPGGAGQTVTPQSHVETFADGVPGLFEALTQTPDNVIGWESFVTPIVSSEVSLQNVDDNMKQNSIVGNCTVAYMSQCMPLNKCRANCASMGSSGFRWFNDHCCECFGDTCSNFGIDDSRCSQCGKGMRHIDDLIHDDIDLETDNDDRDYGEDTDTRDPDSRDL